MSAQLQLYINCLAAREEVIFLVRILTHQIFCDNQTPKNIFSVIRETYQELTRGEKRREAVENQAIA